MSERSEHPEAEVLSAYVDGSLEPDESAGVRAHLLSCPDCRSQERQLHLVREVVRTLPFVEPPRGFYERTLRQGPRPRSAANQRFGIAVTVAILMLVGVLVVVAVVRRRPYEVRPAVPEVMAAFGDVHRDTPPTAGTTTPVAGMPGTLPGGYRLASVLTNEGREYLVYTNGDRDVTVTWTDGQLDQLDPLDGAGVARAIAIEDGTGWYVETATTGLLFIERGERVYTIELPLEQDPVVVAAAVPPLTTDPSAGDRVEAAGRSLLEAFGFGG